MTQRWGCRGRVAPTERSTVTWRCRVFCCPSGARECSHGWSEPRSGKRNPWNVVRVRSSPRRGEGSAAVNQTCLAQQRGVRVAGDSVAPSGRVQDMGDSLPRVARRPASPARRSTRGYIPDAPPGQRHCCVDHEAPNRLPWSIHSARMRKGRSRTFLALLSRLRSWCHGQRPEGVGRAGQEHCRLKCCARCAPALPTRCAHWQWQPGGG